MPFLLSVGRCRGNLHGRESSGDLASQLDAAFHAPKELRVAVAPLAARARFQAVSGRRRSLFLERLLTILAAPLPGLPVSPFQLIDAGQLPKLCLCEVVEPLPLPLGLNGPQVPAHGALADADGLGDLSLTLLPQVQASHSRAPLLDL
jgi:hypothetical protein